MKKSSFAVAAKSALAGLGISLAMLGAGAAQAQSVGGLVGGGHFRVEVRGGWDRLSIPNQNSNINGPGSTNTGTQRGLYGVGVGYDKYFGNHVVVGIESNVMFQGGGSSCSYGVVAAGDQLCGRLRNDWDIGGRLGYHVENATFYGRLAYARTSVRTSYASADFDSTNRGTSQGVRIGAGAEFAIHGPLYVKAEYTWTGANYDSDKLTGAYAGGAYAARNINKNQNQILGGIGVRF